MHIHTLQPTTDLDSYRTAWCWRETYPRRFRSWDMITEFNEWFALQTNRISVGVITTRLIALITLESKGEGVYEVHFDCERRPDMQAILWAVCSVQKQMFEEWGVRELFAGVVGRNRGIVHLLQALGFTPDGISEQVGELRYIRMSQTKEAYAQRENQDRHESHRHYQPVASGPVQYGQHV